MIEIVLYQQEDGRSPYNDWFSSLRDRTAQVRIASRLRNLQAGNLGDYAPVGEGVLELRLHFGPGYRIYCGRSGENWVILLCGGDKSSQSKDIQNAKANWADWKRRRT